MISCEILKSILDAIPYQIVFTDCDHIIRFMNKQAEIDFADRNPSILNRSLLEYHNENSNKMILGFMEHFRSEGGELFEKVNDKNQKVYITPIGNEGGNLLGYFERYESNISM